MNFPSFSSDPTDNFYCNAITGANLRGTNYPINKLQNHGQRFEPCSLTVYIPRCAEFDSERERAIKLVIWSRRQHDHSSENFIRKVFITFISVALMQFQNTYSEAVILFWRMQITSINKICPRVIFKDNAVADGWKKTADKAAASFIFYFMHAAAGVNSKINFTYTTATTTHIKILIARLMARAIFSLCVFWSRKNRLWWYLCSVKS